MGDPAFGAEERGARPQAAARAKQRLSKHGTSSTKAAVKTTPASDGHDRQPAVHAGGQESAGDDEHQYGRRWRSRRTGARWPSAATVACLPAARFCRPARRGMNMANSEIPGPRTAASDERPGSNEHGRRGPGEEPAPSTSVSRYAPPRPATEPSTVPAMPMNSPSRSSMRTIWPRVVPMARRMANCRRRSPTFIRNVLRIMKTASPGSRRRRSSDPARRSLRVSLASVRARGWRADERPGAAAGRSPARTCSSSAPGSSTMLTVLIVPGVPDRTWAAFKGRKMMPPWLKPATPCGVSSPTIVVRRTTPSRVSEFDLVAHLDAQAAGEARSSITPLAVDEELPVRQFVVADCRRLAPGRCPSPAASHPLALGDKHGRLLDAWARTAFTPGTSLDLADHGLVERAAALRPRPPGRPGPATFSYICL